MRAHVCPERAHLICPLRELHADTNTSCAYCPQKRLVDLKADTRRIRCGVCAGGGELNHHQVRPSFGSKILCGADTASIVPQTTTIIPFGRHCFGKIERFIRRQGSQLIILPVWLSSSIGSHSPRGMGAFSFRSNAEEYVGFVRKKVSSVDYRNGRSGLDSVI